MDESPYTKREVDNLLTHIATNLEGMRAENKEGMSRIEVQTTKTNGRVTRLEKYMYMVMGAIAILSFLISNNFLEILK